MTTATRLAVATFALGALLMQAQAAQPPAAFGGSRLVTVETSGSGVRRGGHPVTRSQAPTVTPEIVALEPTLTRRGTRMLPMAAADDTTGAPLTAMTREPVMTARGTRTRSIVAQGATSAPEHEAYIVIARSRR